jgi:prophage regulatory protein
MDILPGPGALAERFLRLPDVIKATGLSKSEIYRRIAAGLFPSGRRYLGSNRVFWCFSEIAAWQREALGGGAPS